MLMPKKVKYRKQQKGRLRGKASRGVNLAFGDYGLQVVQTGFINKTKKKMTHFCLWTSPSWKPVH